MSLENERFHHLSSEGSLANHARLLNAQQALFLEEAAQDQSICAENSKSERVGYFCSRRLDSKRRVGCDPRRDSHECCRNAPLGQRVGPSLSVGCGTPCLVSQSKTQSASLTKQNVFVFCFQGGFDSSKNLFLRPERSFRHSKTKIAVPGCPTFAFGGSRSKQKRKADLQGVSATFEMNEQV